MGFKLFVVALGDFERICNLAQLQTLCIDGFWGAFDDLPAKIASSPDLQVKLGYLRARFQAAEEPLM